MIRKHVKESKLSSKGEKESRIFEELKNLDLESLPCRFIQIEDPCKDISKYFNFELTKPSYPLIFELVTTELNNVIRYQAVIKIHMTVLDLFTEGYFPDFDMRCLFGNWTDLYRNSSQFWLDYLFPIFNYLTSNSSKVKSTAVLIEETLMAFTKIDIYFQSHFKFHIHSPQYFKYYKTMEATYPAFQEVILWCNRQEIFIKLFKKITLENLFMFPRLNFGTVGTIFEQLQKKFPIPRKTLTFRLCYDDMKSTLERAKSIIRVEDMLRKLRKIEILIIGYDKQNFPESEAVQNLPVETFRLTNYLLTRPEFPNEMRALLCHATAHLFTPDKKRFLVKILLFSDFLLITKILKKMTPIKLKVFRSISLQSLCCFCNDKENSFNLFDDKPFQNYRESFCIVFSKKFDNFNEFLKNIEIAKRNALKFLQTNMTRNESKLRRTDSPCTVYKYQSISLNPRHSLDAWLDDCVDSSPYFNASNFDRIIPLNSELNLKDVSKIHPKYFSSEKYHTIDNNNN